MPIFKQNLHMGTKDPLIQTDDLSDKAITEAKMSTELVDSITMKRDLDDVDANDVRDIFEKTGVSLPLTDAEYNEYAANVETAKSKASDAAFSADAAAVDALAAKNSAKSAQDSAAAAEQSAETAVATASSASKDASDALKASVEAASVAKTADENASSALENAKTAISNSEEALGKANKIYTQGQIFVQVSDISKSITSPKTGDWVLVGDSSAEGFAAYDVYRYDGTSWTDTGVDYTQGAATTADQVTDTNLNKTQQVLNSEFDTEISTLNSNVFGFSETQTATLITDGTINQQFQIKQLTANKKYTVSVNFTTSSSYIVNIYTWENESTPTRVQQDITSGTSYAITTQSLGRITIEATENGNPGTSVPVTVNISSASLDSIRQDISDTQEDVATNTTSINTISTKVNASIIEKTSTNLIDETKLASGKAVNPSTGLEYSISTCKCSDFISVTASTTIYTQASGSKTFNFLPVVFYDSDKNRIGSTVDSFPDTSGVFSEKFVTPPTCAYIRMSVYYTATQIMFSYTDTTYEEYSGGYTLSDSIKTDIGVGLTKTITVKKSGGDYSTLKEALDYAGTIASSDNPIEVHIYDGTYDLYAELGGTEYIGAITSDANQSLGVSIPDYVSIIGHGNVYLNYQPSDDDIKTLGENGIYPIKCVSGININSNVTLENLTISVKNARYGIHDETGGETNPNCTHIYKNCRVEHLGNYVISDSLKWTSMAAVAIGSSGGNVYKFTNCTFTGYQFWSWSIHDNNNQDGIIIDFDGCEFNGSYTERGVTWSGKLSAYKQKKGIHHVTFKNCTIPADTKWCIRKETESATDYTVDGRYVVHNFTDIEFVSLDD